MKNGYMFKIIAYNDQQEIYIIFLIIWVLEVHIQLVDLKFYWCNERDEKH